MPSVLYRCIRSAGKLSPGQFPDPPHRGVCRSIPQVFAAVLGNDIVSTGGGVCVIRLGRGIDDSADDGLGTGSLIIDASLSTGGLKMSDIGSGRDKVQANDGGCIADIAAFDRLTLLGSSHNHRVFGFGGADVPYGRARADVRDRGAGNDTLTGGAGTKLFIFSGLWNTGEMAVAATTI